MEGTGYILDKAPDGTAAIYSMTPSESLVLKRVPISNAMAPPFSAVMTATALNKRIVTYTPSNNGTPSMNLFDTVTGTWSGPGLIKIESSPPPSPSPSPSPPPPKSESKLPIGAIIGGVLGGLAVIALVIFGIRRHRRGYHQADVEPQPESFSDEPDNVDEAVNFDKSHHTDDKTVYADKTNSADESIDIYKSISFEAHDHQENAPQSDTSHYSDFHTYPSPVNPQATS
ncbi:hypothetical protein DFQ27_004307 [Actinomortierella ambigua]|uniref:Uncharacterized protein n=1 Tax=Actinomortierella ambigua TaxID=1343610 RepID=A0A9P6QHU4_9FUNG|nr:hypothetical protein DFQ27_004307 [Actinomortierella ambigua]